MSDETTVLLVKGAPLPDGLQAQLEAKGVFVEEASPSHLDASLMAVAPDLVLVIGVEPLDAVMAAVDASSVPVVVVADRQVHRDLRQKYKEALGTIVPSDLPHSALSHRIATLSRRASKGEALVQTMSLAPPKASKEATVEVAPQPATAARAAGGPKPLSEVKPAPFGKAEPAKAAAPKAAAEVKPVAASRATEPKPVGAAGGGARPLSAAKVAPEGRSPERPLAEAKPALERAAAEAKGSPVRTAAGPARPGPVRDTSPALARAAGVAAARVAPAPPEVRPESNPRSSPVATALGKRQEESPRASKVEAVSPPSSMADSSAFSGDEEYPTAAFRLPVEMQHKARRDSVPPETVRRSASGSDLSERLDQQEALVAQEIETRQRLSSGGDEPPAPPTVEDQKRADEADQRARHHRRSHATASAVRLVLCDDDLTRADALASELREHGLDVMLLSPEHSQVRWPRLRRFAPHGLLVDERSLSKGGRQIVSAFRRDPFLKYVPLVVVPFQRIYREAEAKANLAPVFPLLAPLGREELGLLEQLASKGEIVVELSQILPSRLVEVLAENAATCVLSTSGAGHRLTWPIAAGRAGKAELTEGVRSQGSSLKAEDALRFLLDQEEAQVVVALRPQIHLTAAEPIGPLLDRVTASVEPPLQHSVAPPGKGAGDAPALERARPTLLGVAPPAAGGAHDVGQGGLPTIPAPKGVLPEGLPAFPTSSDRDLGLALGGAATAETRPPPPLSTARGSEVALGLAAQLEARLAPALAQGRRFGQKAIAILSEKKRLWPAPLFWAALVLPVLIVLLLLALLLTSGEPESAELGSRPALPIPPAAAPPAAAPSAPPPAPAFDRFRVAADQAAPSCDDVLGGIPVTTGDASGYWKTARQALMQGNVERAHEMMCRAVARDPASTAAEGLVAFYLSRRAIGRADHHVKGILAVDPGRRTALELESDVRSQQGQVDEALRILLQTLRLEPTDSVRRASVSRKLAGEADLAIKSGDFPLAERLLRRAVVLSPTNDQATLRLAEVFLRAGLRDAAKLWAEQLLAGPSRHAEAHMILGDVARLGGDPAAARRHYEQVTPDSGQHTRAQNQLKSLP